MPWPPAQDSGRRVLSLGENHWCVAPLIKILTFGFT